jgi:hypothetical protein
MRILNRCWTAGGALAAALLLAAVPVFAGGEDAKKHAAEMMTQADEMVKHGEAGHLDVMQKHAQEMITHARGAVTAIPAGDMHGKEGKMHLEAAIKDATDAISHGKAGHADVAMKAAKSAQGHAKEGKMHIDGMQ